MRKNKTVLIFLLLALISLAVVVTRKILQRDHPAFSVQEVSTSSLSGEQALNRRVQQLETELSQKNSEIERLRGMAADPSGKAVADAKGADDSAQVKMPVGQGQNADIQKLLGNLLAGGLLSGHGSRKGPSLRKKYDALFEGLGLSAQTSDAMVALLERRTPFLSAEEQAAIALEIKDLLGDEGYAVYQRYEHELPTRLFVDDFSSALTEAGCPLTDDQLAYMHKLDPAAVEKIPLSYSPMSITLNSAAGANVAEMIDGAVGEAADDFSATLEHAEGVLTKEQMAIFDGYLGERLQQKENAAAVAGTLLPGIINPEMLKNLGGSGGVSSSITIISEEAQIPVPNL